MKHLIVVMFLAAAPLWGSPCSSAPLTDYLTNGFSCSVEGLTFSNFSYGFQTTGLTGNPTPGSVLVVPVSGGLKLVSDQFSVGNSDNNNPGGTMNLFFNYQVSGQMDWMGLGWMVGNSGDTGNNYWTLNEYAGSNFLSLQFCSDCPGPPTGTSRVIPLTYGFGVSDQLFLEAGTGGDSSLNWLDNQFSPTPEPAAIALFGTSMLLLAHKLKGNTRARQ